MEEDAAIELLTRLSLAWLPHSFMAGQTLRSQQWFECFKMHLTGTKLKQCGPEREGDVQVNHNKIGGSLQHLVSTLLRDGQTQGMATACHR
jgi:hypothetical protein